MIKEVPIDGPGFQAVLKEIIPLGSLAPMQLSRHGNCRGLRPVLSYPTIAGSLRCRFIHRGHLSPHLRSQGWVEAIAIILKAIKSIHSWAKHLCCYETL